MRTKDFTYKIVFILLNTLSSNVFCENTDNLPWLIEGPISSNDIDLNLPFSALPEYDLNDEVLETDQERPIIEKVVIKSNITNRIDATSANFFVKNPSIEKTQELAFSIEIPHNEYKVTNLSLQILGDERIYTHENKKQDSKALYRKLLSKNQAGLLLHDLEKAKPKSFDEAIMMSLKVIIPPGEKQHIKLDYEGPLVESGNGTWHHMIHINPHQLVQNFQVLVDINDTLPITSVHAFEIRDGSPIFGFSDSTVKCENTSEECRVEFHPNNNKKKENDGYDMNGQYYLSFSRNKTLLLSKIGDRISNEFDTLNTFNVTSLPEFISIFEGISASIGFMFNMLLMVPFIILTEFLSAFYVITSEIFGLNTDWYLKEKRWYEKEMEYEMDRLDHAFSKMDEIFEDSDGTFDFHLEANGPLTFSHFNPDPFSKFAVFEDTFDKLRNEEEETKYIKKEKINKPSKLKAAEKNDFFLNFLNMHQFPGTINWTSSHSGSMSFHG